MAEGKARAPGDKDMRRSHPIRELTRSRGRPVSAEDIAALYSRYPVLYVDDDPPNLDVFDESFGEEYRVICVASGGEALEVLAREPVALMITDNRMPDMTGIDLCAEVMKRYPHVIRVLCTAYSDQQTAIDAINRGGVQNYLVKPWDAAEVAALISDLIVAAHFEEAARALRQGLLSEERRAAIAVMRKRLHHELTDVITVVSNATRAIERALPDVRAGVNPDVADDVEACVEDLWGASDKLAAIHKETRAATVSEGPVAEEENLLEIIESVTRLVWAELTGVATLEYTCPPDMLVFVDRISVLRVLFNLVNHCVRALEDGATRPGVVRIQGVRDDGGVCVDVSHNAQVSVEAERRALASSALTGVAAGTEVDPGLPICRELAEANGGVLEILEVEAPWTPVLRLRLPDGDAM